MGDREFFKVKDGSAFAAIKGKKVYITKAIPNTTSGVIVCINGTSDTYKFLREELEPWVEPISSKPVSLPWTDLKVAFGMTHHANRLWRANEEGRLDLPEGWTLVESDASGSRYVVIFRVDVMPTEADAYKVKAQIRRFDR